MTSERSDVPYPAWPIAEAHLERLAVAARLRGLEPAPPSSCRVLEVGCGAGGHLLPLAAAFPESRFVGLDVDAHGIEAASSLARELKLDNVRFLELDVGQASGVLDGDELDYAIAHGVYSWVPESARASLLELFGGKLAQHGVAYVSYAAYPGFFVRDMLRDMLRHHAGDAGASSEGVRRARELSEALALSPLLEAGAPELLRREVAALVSASDVRLAYDDLVETRGFWLEEVTAHASQHGLRFLGDAVSDLEITPYQGRADAVLRELQGDPLARAAYLDLLSLRRFNRTLFCRAERVPAATKDAARLRGLYLSCSPSSGVPNAPGENWALTGTDGSVVTVREPALRAALSQARQRWPESVLVDELEGEPSGGLLTALLRLYEAGVIRLATGPATCVAVPSARPMASACARACARLGRPVASQYHEQVDLPRPLAQLLTLLDGTRDHAALRQELESRGQPIASAAELLRLLEDLAQNALLMA